MTAKIIQFPLKDTMIFKWYSSALAVKKQVNLASAQQWIKRNVPEQFQKMINKNVRIAK